MIQFDSLIEAIQYIKHCPLCKERLIVKRDTVTRHTLSAIHTWEVETIFTFTESNADYSDKIKICMENQTVERDITQFRETKYGIQGVVSFHANYPLTCGDKYLGLGMECPNCRNYNFMIQIVVSLKPLRMTKICLNSESLTFDGKEKTYEIRNIYTTGQTEYVCYAGTGSGGEEGTVFVQGRQTFPLISFDRNDPHRFLQRVKNLLIFT